MLHHWAHVPRCAQGACPEWTQRPGVMEGGQRFCRNQTAQLSHTIPQISLGSQFKHHVLDQMWLMFLLVGGRLSGKDREP